MIPFDLSRLDSNAVSDNGNGKKPVMDRILDIAKVRNACLQEIIFLHIR